MEKSNSGAVIYDQVMKKIGEYHPSSGSRLNRKIDIKYIKGASPQAIKNFERHIAFNEIWHWGAFILTSIFTLERAFSHDYATAIAMLGLNTSCNVISILLQRHNRRRLNEIKKRHNR